MGLPPLSGSLLAVIAVALLIVYFAILGALHVRDTGYSAIRNAVSDYGVGRTAGRFRIAVIANSLGILALTGALSAEFGEDTFVTADYVFLLLIPVTRLAMVFFPTDLDGARSTWAGRIHLVLAIASFTFVYLAIADLTAPLSDSAARALAVLLIVLRWTAAIGLAAVVVTLVVPALRRIFGLSERVYLVSTNLWFLAVAAWIAAQSP
jgi:hypothetical protein